MNSKKKKVNMVPWRVKVYHGLPDYIPAPFYVIHMVKHMRQDRQMLPSQRLLSTSREDYRHY